tara:strand:+ start:78 stop:539 length:462 start_codon:yes stop_codon:yes gene_type:complete
MENTEKKVIICELDNECPICLNNINDFDPFIIMPCCNNKIHIQCLIEWYSSNSKSNTCFMCNQNTNIHKSLLTSNDLSLNNDLETNDVETNDIERNDVERNNFQRNTDNLSITFVNNNRNNRNNTRYCIKLGDCILFYPLIAIAVILIIIFKS